MEQTQKSTKKYKLNQDIIHTIKKNPDGDATTISVTSNTP